MRLIAVAAALWAVAAGLSGCAPAQAPCIPPPDFSPVEPARDAGLQAGLEKIVRELDLGRAAEEHRLAIELVDITNLCAPRAAGVNADYMMYAASLPKIAILFGLLKRVDAGELAWTPPLQRLAVSMIQYSSNTAATELFRIVGPEYINALLTSPDYRLYSAAQGGGLWVGKEYGPAPAWRRDPLKQLSHAASPTAVARFYYLMETGRLASPRITALMKHILGRSALHHKFVRGIERRTRHAQLYRKSGSWRNFHSDSAMIEHDGKRYIAVALIDDEQGLRWLEDLIARMDDLIPAPKRSA